MSTTRTAQPATAAPEEPSRDRHMPADQTFGWALGVLVRAYQSVVVGVLGDCPHGVRGYQALAAVVEGDQPNQLALATYLGIDRTVMTYLIDDLVDAGLVERRQNPADRRQRKIVATDYGVASFREHQRRVVGAEDALMRALRPADRDTLRDLLRRVACDLRDIDPDGDPFGDAEALPDGTTPPG